jgi:hypothetical protein
VRDFGFLKRPSVLVAVGSAILLGVSVISLESLSHQQNPLEGMLQEATKIIKLPETSL